MQISLFDRSDFKRLANSMSKAFRDSQGGGILERFEAVSKLLFIKMVDDKQAAGTWKSGDGTPAEAQLVWRQGDTSRTVYERARGLWTDTLANIPGLASRGSRALFPADVEAVARSIRLMEPYDLDALGVDVKGAAYEELLRDTFEKNDNQQYFTPHHLMDFVVAMAAPTSESVVLDPACGSGGFLVGALTRATGDKPKVYGVDIDERMAWVARINVFLHGGDPSSIHSLTGAGSLRPLSQIQQILPREHFSLILTNPPFGSDMTDHAALQKFQTGKGRSSRRRGVLFVERCLELLKPGGRLAIVLDDSVLNLSGNSDIRSIVRDQTIVEAIISLPDVTFMPYSTAKSSVLMLRKKSAKEEQQGPVFMADVEQIGNRPNGDPLYHDTPLPDGTRPLLSDLPEVLTAWNEFQSFSYLPEKSIEKHLVFLADVDEYLNQPGGDRLDVNFFHPARKIAESTLDRATAPVYELNDILDFPSTSAALEEVFGDGVVPWIGLGEIEAKTGEFTVAEMAVDRIKSQPHFYQAGDLLVSRMRPRLRKVIKISDTADSGACSAELVVLRPKESSPVKVLMPYIEFMLRTDLSFGQQVYQITGVGRPRIGVPALKRLRIPVPSVSKQQDLINEFQRSQDEYRKLMRAAEELTSKAQNVLSQAYEDSVSELVSSESTSSARENTILSCSGSAARMG